MEIFVDYENLYDEAAGITLKKLPLRVYLERAPIIGVGWGIDDGPMQWLPATSPDFIPWHMELGELIQDPANVVIGHRGAAYDCRVMRFGVLEAGGEPLGLPYPSRVRDSMELAMAAWPNQPTGYSLRALATYFGLPPKLSMQDARSGKVTWEEYCVRDAELCREVYRRALARVTPEEVFVSELANRIRELHYVVDAAQVERSFKEFSGITDMAVEAAESLFTALGRDGEAIADEIFGGHEEGAVRSVKPIDLKRILLEQFGFDSTTTSLKKINPAKLARALPEVSALLQQTSAAGRGLYYKRRAAGLIGVREIDMELAYFAATNSGRYSAPSCGKGVNKHNLSKRDKAVAKPLRKMFSLPDDLCMVQADAANVEYRIECLLSGCQYGLKLFDTAIDADPYSAFARRAFGVDSVSPALRQLCKAAVLGLGFAMGLVRWMEELTKIVSDPKSGLALSDLDAICMNKGWKPPTKSFVKGAQTRVGCAWQIATVAFESRDAFHKVHYEFFKLADWLQYTVEQAAGGTDPERALDYCYRLPGAPSRDLLALSIDSTLEFPTVRVRCLGHSQPTVTWRHLSVTHPGVDGLGAVTATKGPRRVHRSLLIENVTQSAARNRLVGAKCALAAKGWRYLDSVHDALRIICPREPGAVLRARADLISVMSDWDFYARPGDITITRTEFEDEKESQIAWAKLAAGDLTWVNHLT